MMPILFVSIILRMAGRRSHDGQLFQMLGLPKFILEVRIRKIIDITMTHIGFATNLLTSARNERSISSTRAKAVGNFFLLLISREHATNMHHAAVRFSSFPSSLHKSTCTPALDVGS